ncbi:hypothetical protein VTO73DRAFT_5660 [Trametes versicolor]
MQFSAYPPIFHRMRTPFFAALTDLALDRCTFDSVCDFFDLVWSCPELSRLVVQDCDVQTGPVDVPAIRQMHAFAREHKTEIFTKLTDLRLYGYPLSTRRFIPGRLFGSTVTTLQIACRELADAYSTPSFLWYCFPALQDVTIVILNTTWHAYLRRTGRTLPNPPYFLALATRHRQVPYPTATLRRLTFRITYAWDGDLAHWGCKALFGEEERADLPEPRSLYPKLERMEVELLRDGPGDECFEHIANAIPSMVDVLRFKDDRGVPFGVVDGHIQMMPSS